MTDCKGKHWIGKKEKQERMEQKELRRKEEISASFPMATPLLHPHASLILIDSHQPPTYTHIHTRTHMHTHTHIQTHTHKHTHTHTVD